MIIIGYLGKIQGLVTWGGIFFIGGFILQILWLFKDRL